MRTTLIASLLGAAALAFVTVTPVAAHPATVTRPIAQVSVTFRVQVAGHDGAGATYWVACGPLGGRFGLVQLHPSGGGRYAATLRLAAAGRAVFAYLAGHGVVHTRFGPAPGNPVVTIERFGPAFPQQLRLHVVYWHAPVG
jgi:hypothetical protein